MNKVAHPKSQIHLVLLLLVSGLLLILSACRTDTSPTAEPGVSTRTPRPALPTSTITPRPTPLPSPTSKPVSPLDVEAGDLRGQTVQFWHIWSGPTGTALRKLVSEFNASNPWGILVHLSEQSGLDGMADKVNTAIQAGNPPDLVVGYNYQAQIWDAGQGNLADLNPYVDDPVWGLLPQEKADFYPLFWNEDVISGKRLGIPAQRSAQLLYYNQSWAKELGFSSPPQTPAQFKEQACAAAQANLKDDNPDNDKTGGWIVSTDYSSLLGWIDAFGGEIVNPKGTGYQFDTPEVKDALNFLRDLYDQGCAWQTENQTPETDFAARRGLFSADSVAGISYQRDAFTLAQNSDEWTVIPFPSPSGHPALDAYGPSFEIFKSTHAKQLATWLFLKWLVLPENQAQLIEASGYLPIRASIRTQPDFPGPAAPQWVAALDLIPDAKPEPGYQSWSVVRWAVSDAGKQLFQWYFTIDQVPNLAKLLDATAADLHQQNP